jgi:hypothetical protein
VDTIVTIEAQGDATKVWRSSDVEIARAERQVRRRNVLLWMSQWKDRKWWGARSELALTGQLGLRRKELLTNEPITKLKRLAIDHWVISQSYGWGSVLAIEGVWSLSSTDVVVQICVSLTTTHRSRCRSHGLIGRSRVCRLFGDTTVRGWSNLLGVCWYRNL